MRRVALCLTLLLPAPAAPAQEAGLAGQARSAEAALEAAALDLGAADTAPNRIRALSRVLRAQETALETLRRTLSRAEARERGIVADLRQRGDAIARVLAALRRRADAPEPVRHPAGPVAMARARMILPDAEAALAARAEELRERLREVARLRSLRDETAETLAAGRQTAQEARAQLATAIAGRAGLPRRFTENAIEAALLAASAGTLGEIVAGLDGIARDEVPGSLPGIGARKGTLPLPAQGMVARAEAGPGILVDTAPHALVSTPVPATVRYRGPLLDHGDGIILEPQDGLMLILAGLDTVFGRPGEVVPGGSPVGLMGGASAQVTAPATALTEGGASQGPMLYIEMRQDNSPVDPLSWFATDKEG